MFGIRTTSPPEALQGKFSFSVNQRLDLINIVYLDAKRGYVYYTQRRGRHCIVNNTKDDRHQLT